MIHYLYTLVEKYSMGIAHIKEYTSRYYFSTDKFHCVDKFNPRYFNYRNLKCCCKEYDSYIGSISRVCDCGTWDVVVDMNTNEVAYIPDRYYFSSFKKYQS